MTQALSTLNLKALLYMHMRSLYTMSARKLIVGGVCRFNERAHGDESFKATTFVVGLLADRWKISSVGQFIWRTRRL